MGAGLAALVQSERIRFGWISDNSLMYVHQNGLRNGLSLTGGGNKQLAFGSARSDGHEGYAVANNRLNAPVEVISHTSSPMGQLASLI